MQRTLQLEDKGKLQDAIRIAEQALLLAEKTFGATDSRTAESLHYLAEVRQAVGQYERAEAAFTRAISIDEKALGPNHPTVAWHLNSLGALYFDEQRYDKAQPLISRALDIHEKALGLDDPTVATDLGNLANLYRAAGLYAEAEPLLKRALDIHEKSLGASNPDVAVDINNLAAVYLDQGRYPEAELLLRRSLSIDEKVFGRNNIAVARDLNNLSQAFYHERRYADEERLLKRALSIIEKASGPNHPNNTTVLNNLAVLYDAQHRYLAEAMLLKRAFEINRKAFGFNHPRVAVNLNALAAVYEVARRYPVAEQLFARALRIDVQALGPNHPTVASDLAKLAEVYVAQRRYADALRAFRRSAAGVFYEFDHQLPYMSERDRLAFLSTARDNIDAYVNFAAGSARKRPELAGDVYNVALRQKGIVLGGVTALRNRIRTTGDTQAIGLLDQLSAIRAELAALAFSSQMPAGQQKAERNRLEQHANDVETALARFLPSPSTVVTPITWRDVQKRLAPDEAAIEFLRLPAYGRDAPAGLANYVALVLTQKTVAHPTLVILGDARKLEGAPIQHYLQDVGIGGNDRAARGFVSFYDAFWKPLEPALSGIQRIYYSPDGVLNQVAPAIVRAPDGRPMNEHYDVRIVFSTRDVVGGQPAPVSSMTAVLVGDPQFNLTEPDQLAALASVQIARLDQSPPATVGGGVRLGNCGTPFTPLHTEVGTIGKLLMDHGWNPAVFVEQNALKAVVTGVNAPRILHLATHGVFLPDPRAANRVTLQNGAPQVEQRCRPRDPMLRSLLAFAGADRLWALGVPSEKSDDGILTAAEAAGLNLQGTELVVLSACDSGLGSEVSGEGVFGLRRALQEAGAQTILMSLWKVPSEQTKALMTAFYHHWLDGNGMNKHAALRAAQQDLARSRTSSPYYWGGFVLVGP